MLYVTTGVAIAAAPLTFVTADIIYGAQGELLPGGWAVPQPVIGALELGYGVLGLAIRGDPNAPLAPAGTELVLPVAITALAFGARQIAHAIWSLVAGGGSEDVGILGVPAPDGASVQVVGRF
jgi:hypothetical protein